MQQLIDAIPKTVDPASRFALRGQVTPTGHQRLRHSMRSALWWLLPSDGEFRRAPNGIQYYLAHQGRRVVLRGGDVTDPLYESRMHWIPDPTPSPPRRTGIDYSDTLVKPSNPPVPIPSDSVRPRDAPVKSCNTSDTQASAIATNVPSGAPLTPPLPRKCRRRRRRKARQAANENTAPRSAAPVTPDERWANHNAGIPGATQHQPEASDPTQMEADRQCTRAQASTLIPSHSLPSQQPIEIRHFL